MQADEQEFSHWPPRDPVAPLACVTMARDDGFFLEIWARHYLAAEPQVRLYILDHASQSDTAADLVARLGPQAARQITVIPLPEFGFDVQYKAAALSALAAALVHGFASVIATDSDEVVLPAPGEAGLMQILAEEAGDCLMPLGFAFVQHLEREAAFDPARPLLEQRHYGCLSAAYTKPAIWRAANRYGPGQHQTMRPARPLPRLILAHLHHVDAAQHAARSAFRQNVAYSESHWARGFGRAWRKPHPERAREFDALLQAPLDESLAALAALFIEAVKPGSFQAETGLWGHPMKINAPMCRFV